jgi:hypothetical protein
VAGFEHAQIEAQIEKTAEMGKSAILRKQPLLFSSKQWETST